ncbi:helix-turn-helix transcriptional regulator [Foetidibacter luteolus]|uniref:helix-turn-helix transcriptional regulator n=1 Tax=Foetidibacter luteolus TaxID=2608880 RepID=UPI00129A7631|nr:helix-turn-helix domain-containing protein [Foetidibacter luteolus]
MTLAAELKKYRFNADKTQKEMAEILGISQQVYNNYEAGRVKRPAPEVLQKFKLLLEQYEGKEGNINEKGAQHVLLKYTEADIQQKIIRVEAMMNVVMSASAEILAKLSDKPVTSVLAQLEAAYSDYLRQEEKNTQ